MKSICHITTVHPRFDVRIFHKECKSLAKHYEVFLIVADGLGDETVDNVKIIDIGLRQTSRLKRARIDSKKALQKALELDCDLYHFHDPELVKIGVKLKKTGKKVIYDTHEDLPRQILGKPYLNKFLKPFIAKFAEWQENKASKRFDYICSATPFIRDRFKKINNNAIDINNYPVLGMISNNINFIEKKDEICYVGGISKYRGVFELIESLQYSKLKLNLAGDFKDKLFYEKCRMSKGWQFVEYHGFVGRDEIKEILFNSKIGIVTLYPLKNYLDSLPVKMFEYMSAGIPVIASDFPYWKEIISENNCGINVNPLNPKDIAKYCIEIIENNDKAEIMGNNGNKAVKEKYNWAIEEKKLLKIYKEILE